jgi:uncharacterized protein
MTAASISIVALGKRFPVSVRAAPFALFVVLMAVEPSLARLLPENLDPRWLYGFRSLLAASLLLAFWRYFVELTTAPVPRAGDFLLALGVGLGVLAIWLVLSDGFFVIGHSGSGFDPRAANGRIDWPLALMRLAGSALVVPLMEELFWRSFVMRWLENHDFSHFDPAAVGLRALLLSSLVFGFEHSQWLAGILAGLAYGWLYRSRRNLWVPVVAHMVTNAGLGCWVLATGAWYFW